MVFTIKKGKRLHEDTVLIRGRLYGNVSEAPLSKLEHYRNMTVDELRDYTRKCQDRPDRLDWAIHLQFLHEQAQALEDSIEAVMAF